MMRFANPDAFQLLWLLPILAGISWYFTRRSRVRMNAALGEKLTPFLTASVDSGRRRFKLILRLLSFALMVVALARPQLGKSMQEVKMQGVEMVIAFDVSTSMLAEDVKPSRLQHAKSEVIRLLDMLGGDKVGLVAFAGSATLVSPLTIDKSSLKMFVESLRPESVETQGTNFKNALDEARQAFERGGIEGDDVNKVTRVILVLSDGEDQEQGAIDEARRLAGDGTRIFTLAFGTERGAPIPLRDERGILVNYKRDKAGGNVLSIVKGDFLRQLAQIGKGSFHHATFGGQEAKLIRDDLQRLQQTEFASSLATNYDEKFQIPLLISLLVALLEMLIGERRGSGRIWKGRFEVSEP
jgi:Ca-activated chloride channel family protein